MKLIEWIKSKFKKKPYTTGNGIYTVPETSGIALYNATTKEVLWQVKGEDAEAIAPIICDDKLWKKLNK